MIVNSGSGTGKNGAPEKHAAQHGKTGSDPVTPASIGAAAEEHEHSGYAAAGHTHTAEEVGARSDHWMPSAADVGAATMEQVNSAIQQAVLDSWQAEI